MNSNSRCFIFSAGDFYGLCETPTEGDLIIAADAGYNLCLQLKLTPNLLIGDFDSMTQPADFSSIIRVPVEKDDTDTMLALRRAIDLGYKEIYIYGGTGGARLDHSIANMQVLAFACRKGARAYLYDKDFVYTVIENDSISIDKTVEWGIVSLFAMDSCVENVYLEGLQYPLINGTLYADTPLGVSNHFAADQAKIRCGKGLLLVGWQIA